MQCDEEIRTWLDQLSVPRADRRGPGLTRVRHPNFDGGTEILGERRTPTLCGRFRVEIGGGSQSLVTRVSPSGG